MSLVRCSAGMSALGRRAGGTLRSGSFPNPVSIPRPLGRQTPSTRTFPVQPQSIASRSGQAVGGMGPPLSIQEVNRLEERTNLAPQNITQLESIFRTLAGPKRYLDFKGFEAGLPLVQTLLQDGGLCPETYLSAFEAFDLDRSGTIEMEEFIVGVGKILRGENHNEKVTECPSWRRISRIVRVGRDLRLTWSQPPRSVLVVKKWNAAEAGAALGHVCGLLAGRGLTALLDPHDPDYAEGRGLPYGARLWAQDDSVDLVVGLGGDGTMLRAIQWLGDVPTNGLLMPPVMAFALGSLGFLTPHAYDNVDAMLDKVLDADGGAPLYCTMRSRLRCEVLTAAGEVRAVRRALNECLVCRGSTSAFQKLDCYVDGQFVAQFQADGVLIATPSGSSAYSMAVGGSLVAPSVPCMLLTPIAPHMLTARPTVLPAGCELELRVPLDARALPMVSFDGMHEEELGRGASVRVATSMSPVPFIHTTQHLDDWFHSISTKLHWATKLRK